MASIIIPCYNMEKYIIDCLLSCVQQDGVEIIVVDDHSVDESYYKAAAFAYDYPHRVQVIQHDTNLGVAAARNTGLRKASYEYVTCVDADDMLTPNSIEVRAKYLDDHPNVDMVWGNAYKINVDRGNYLWGYEKCIRERRALEVYSRRLNAQTVMWRTSVFDKYGLYYEKLRSREDKELLYRLGLHPDSPMPKVVKAKKLNEFMAIYRRHPQAKHKRRIKDKVWAKETEKIFKKRIADLKKNGITEENTEWMK